MKRLTGRGLEPSDIPDILNSKEIDIDGGYTIEEDMKILATALSDETYKLIPLKRRRKDKKGKNGGGGLQGKDYQDRLKQSGGRGEKTGVDLRWHTNEDYQRLSEEERAELYQWRNKSPKKAKPHASVADAKLAALEKQQNDIAAAIQSLTSAITSVVPGANISAMQAVVAAVDEASSQPTGESENAEAGLVDANDGDGDGDGDDDRKPSAVTFASIESDIKEQTRIAAAVGLASILKSTKISALERKVDKQRNVITSIAQSKKTTAAKNSELKRELRNLRSTNDIAVAENAALREKNEELRKEIESKDEILLRMENLTKSNEMTITENTELKKRVETLKQLFKSECEKVRDVETVKKASDEELRKRIDELHEEIERKDLEMKRTSTLKKVTKWTSVETKQITNTPLPEQVAIQIQGVGTAAMQSAVDEYRKEIDSLKVKAKVEKEQLLSRLKSAENELDGLKQIVARNKEEQNSLKKLQKGTLDQLVEKLKVISDLQKVNEKLSKDVERKETTLKQITDLIGGRSTDKEKELESTIAQDRKEISSLKEQLKNSRPIETVDLTNANEIERSTSSDGDEDSTEEEPPQKRRRMESNLAIALEQTQQMVKVKEEAMQRAAAAEASVEAARREKDAAEASLRNVKEQSQQIVSVKQEAIQRAAAAEASVEAARREKDAVEASLKDVQEDLEDANEVVTQQTLATDIWQGRFDEIFELARAAGVDGKTLSEIRHRPLSSGS